MFVHVVVLYSGKAVALGVRFWEALDWAGLRYIGLRVIHDPR